MYIDERHFVKTAIQNMDLLEEIWATIPTNGHIEKADQTKTALNAIKSSAVSVQARGVYRAAALCEDVLVRLTPDNKLKINASLVKLKRLINLYADGLFEIDPEFASALHQPATITPPDLQLSDAHAQAIEILTPLAHRVENTKLRNALKSLMRPVNIGSMDQSDRKTMSLDALIQPISNLVLSEARHCGKAVTVSYAADFAEMAYETAETVQEILEAACLKIVSDGILSPSSSDAGPTPQISMTGQSRGGKILFSVSWMGREISSAANLKDEFQAKMENLEQKGGSHSFNNLTLSDELKSRHTLYITLPMIETAGLKTMSLQSKTRVGAGGHA